MAILGSKLLFICSGFNPTLFSASLNVFPVSSRAIRNLASSLHSSQSLAAFACSNKCVTCLSPASSSSRLCSTSKYPPAVLSLPSFNDSSKSSFGGGRCANNVRHDRTSVFRVHCTTISRNCGNDDSNVTMLGRSDCSSAGGESTSSSKTSCKRTSSECAKYSKCL